MNQTRKLLRITAGSAALLAAAGCGLFQGKQAPPVVGGACEYTDHPGTFEVVRRVPWRGHRRLPDLPAARRRQAAG